MRAKVTILKQTPNVLFSLTKPNPQEKLPEPKSFRGGKYPTLDAFIFSIVRMLVSFAVIAGIIYLIYYFFILTEDQRKYRKAMRKYKRNQRRK